MAKRLTYPALTLFAVLAMLAFGAQRAHADQRDFVLVNGSSSVTIVHVYVAASTVDDWQDDILGQDVLVPGDSVTVHFSKYSGDAGQCLYDVRVVGKDGEEGVLYNIDLCSTTSVTFS